MSFCTKCGTTYQDGAATCPSCGQAAGHGVAAVSSPKTSALAISALVMGLLGMICIVPVVGLTALILGIAAMVAIKRRPGLLTGNGLAITGIVLGGLEVLAGTLIIVAIAVPNFVAAKNRQCQKRTMSDMRSIAVAVETYAVDHYYYPAASSIDELAPHIEPHYIKSTPTLDGWENPYRFRSWVQDSEAPDNYRIGSAGSDGEWEHDDLRDYPEQPTSSFRADIVYGNGLFIQYPEGPQGIN